MKEILAQKYKIKTETMGEGKDEHKEVRILNRVIRYTPKGVCLEADPRHAERVVKEMKVEEGKTSPVPGSNEDVKTWLEDEDTNPGGAIELVGEEATTYRGVAAVLNYLAADRPDLQFAVKEAAREMSSPKKRSWGLLKKLARYLRGKPRAVI